MNQNITLSSYMASILLIYEIKVNINCRESNHWLIYQESILCAFGARDSYNYKLRTCFSKILAWQLLLWLVLVAQY